MAKIGIMGGTFNPIHIGHLILAQTAMEEMHLDEIWMIPTGCSYMKNNQEILDAKTRLKLVELAIKGNTSFKCVDIEVNRKGNSYTYETLDYLKKQFPENHFYFICGADCLFTIEKWKKPEHIFQNCTLLVAVRNNASDLEMEEKIVELRKMYQADIVRLPFLNLDISSTMIRKKIQSKQSVRYFLPIEVFNHICLNQLYVQ